MTFPKLYDQGEAHLSNSKPSYIKRTAKGIFMIARIFKLNLKPLLITNDKSKINAKIKEAGLGKNRLNSHTVNHLIFT